MTATTISDTERREVAARLRHSWANVPDKNPVRHQLRVLFEIYSAVGLADDDNADAIDLFARLADLIDPTCEARRDTLLYPATGLTPEHEETVYRCGECGEIISYDEDYDPETDLPAYCERCVSRITGIGEPWDE